MNEAYRDAPSGTLTGFTAVCLTLLFAGACERLQPADPEPEPEPSPVYPIHEDHLRTLEHEGGRDMRCPTCEKDGVKHRVYRGGSSTTLMAAPPPYWDENDNYIVPSGANTTTTVYNCSNGHRFESRTRLGKTEVVMVGADDPTTYGAAFIHVNERDTDG